MIIEYEHGDNVIIVYSTFDTSGKCVVYAEGGYIIKRSDALWFKPEIEIEYMYRYYEFEYGLFDLFRKNEFQLKEHRYGVHYKPMRLLNTYDVDAKIFPIENKIVAEEYAKKLLDKYKYDNVVKNMNKDELFDYVFERDHYQNEPLMDAVKRRKAELDHED